MSRFKFWFFSAVTLLVSTPPAFAQPTPGSVVNDIKVGNTNVTNALNSIAAICNRQSQRLAYLQDVQTKRQGQVGTIREQLGAAEAQLKVAENNLSISKETVAGLAAQSAGLTTQIGYANKDTASIVKELNSFIAQFRAEMAPFVQRRTAVNNAIATSKANPMHATYLTESLWAAEVGVPLDPAAEAHVNRFKDLLAELDQLTDTITWYTANIRETQSQIAEFNAGARVNVAQIVSSRNAVNADLALAKKELATATSAVNTIRASISRFGAQIAALSGLIIPDVHPFCGQAGPPVQ